MATDITITQEITIELDGKSPFEYVVMKQGDKDSRILAVSLLQNKQPYEIPTGCAARIKYYKPDGNPVLNDCTLSGNKILVTYEATIKSTYKLIGNIPANDGADFWIGDIGVDTETCAWFVKAVGSSDRQGWGDRCYAGGKSTSGTREDLGRGSLGSGASGGPVFVYCGAWLDWALWSFLGCD